MSEGHGSGERDHIGRTPFWALLVLVAVGLAVMIVTPLTGR
ncbi:hypothetical protein [Promicromonospora sp. NPDC019610]